MVTNQVSPRLTSPFSSSPLTFSTLNYLTVPQLICFSIPPITFHPQVSWIDILHPPFGVLETSEPCTVSSPMSNLFPPLSYTEFEIRLPYGILDVILQLLSFHAYALLACFLTCVNCVGTRSGGGDYLREDIQCLSTSARCFSRLDAVAHHQSSLSAISLTVPFKLSMQLVHSKSLSLRIYYDTSSIYPSVWLFLVILFQMYHSSRRNTWNFLRSTPLSNLCCSFRSLEHIVLGSITSTQYQVRRTLRKRTIRWGGPLRDLLWRPGCVQFINAFSRWTHLNNITFRKLVIEDYVSFYQFWTSTRERVLEHSSSLDINDFEEKQR